MPFPSPRPLFLSRSLSLSLSLSFHVALYIVTPTFLATFRMQPPAEPITFPPPECVCVCARARVCVQGPPLYRLAFSQVGTPPLPPCIVLLLHTITYRIILDPLMRTREEVHM